MLEPSVTYVQFIIHATKIYTVAACVCQGYIVDLFQGLIDRQGWSDSGSVSERVLRSYLLLFACVRNYAPSVNKATQLFKQWKDSDGQMRSGVIVLKSTSELY